MKTFFLTLTLAFALVGCSAEHSNKLGSNSYSSIEAVSDTALAAFQNTVYSFGHSKACVKCHGASVNPMWLNSDVRMAYSFARPFLDVANPSASTFATYVSNRHCNDAACSDPANVAPMQDALFQWAEVELSEAGGSLPGSATPTTLANPPFVTQPVAIPANLPVITTNQSVVMRFDLSQLAPNVPALNGAFLEINIQAYNSALTTYKLSNPRIVGNTAPVSYAGLHVYIRAATGTGLGQEFINGGCRWSPLMGSVQVASTSPLTPLSLAIPVQSVADVITIGFVDIH